VNIFGMLAGHDDVIHADFHGAVVIPADCVKKLPDAIDLVSRREKVILDMAKSPGFTAQKMAEALKKSGEIH
jgi:regulator of RNase E activity RraA